MSLEFALLVSYFWKFFAQPLESYSQSLRSSLTTPCFLLQIATVYQEWDLTKGSTCRWMQKLMRKTLCPRKHAMSAKSTATLRKTADKREVFANLNPLLWVNLALFCLKILSIRSHVYYVVKLYVASVKLQLSWNLMAKLMGTIWQRPVNQN